MKRQKWHFSRENFQPGDVIYFKITESKMSAIWKLGIVVEVKVGHDGFVMSSSKTGIIFKTNPPVYC